MINGDDPVRNNPHRMVSSSAETVYLERLGNGLIVAAKEMPWLQSAAFTIAIPAGCRFDPPGQRGLANFTCELVSRGGGGLTHRQFVDFMESQGCLYWADASNSHTYFGGALPADNVYTVLERYAGLLLNPALPQDQMDDSRRVCFQEIQAIEDDLPERVMIALRDLHYGEPDGWHAEGSMDSVEGIQWADVERFYRQHYQPTGAIIGVAGNIKWPELLNTMERLFGAWSSRTTPAVTSVAGRHGAMHLPFESQQTHIGLAWPAITYRHPDYFLARAGIGILSDGMSSRLFREVRERRGLCYAVSASCHTLRDSGCMVAYCGTTPAFAQESLDVMVEEIRRLKDGVTEEELARLKVQLRSHLIMKQESCRAIAGGLVGDVYHLDRARSLSELSARIEGLTVGAVNRFWQDFEIGPFDLVNLGEHPLELRDGISATTT
ncbi:MAG TPA: pitrilysin family protein [Pirellulaceae bacterium]|nr:pitrilysin family protein [Pirellulaceae bacterium]